MTFKKLQNQFLYKPIDPPAGGGLDPTDEDDDDGSGGTPEGMPAWTEDNHEDDQGEDDPPVAPTALTQADIDAAVAKALKDKEKEVEARLAARVAPTPTPAALTGPLGIPENDDDLRVKYENAETIADQWKIIEEKEKRADARREFKSQQAQALINKQFEEQKLAAVPVQIDRLISSLPQGLDQETIEFARTTLEKVTPGALANPETKVQLRLMAQGFQAELNLKKGPRRTAPRSGGGAPNPTPGGQGDGAKQTRDEAFWGVPAGVFANPVRKK